MKFLRDLDLTGKRVLIRADLNVPLDDNLQVTDANRIKEFLPTLQQILDAGGKPIVMSHFGDPGGKVEPTLSLKPVAAKMKELLSREVTLAPDCVGPEVEKLSHSLKDGEVLLLENLRFHKGESKNDPEFASELAKLGEIFVGDAFATAHRAHASMVGVPEKFKEKAAGLLMQRELEYFNRAMLEPKRPLCVILGGAKISSKLAALINISDKADKIIIGGAMANTFLAAQGIQMGRSLYEPELQSKVLELVENLRKRGCQLYLPVDFIVGPALNSIGQARAVPAQEIPSDMMALDIGPATTLLYKEAVESAQTILWNGPMGAFENEEYAKGTFGMIDALTSSKALTVVGGGDTDAAIHHMGVADKFGYLSTGGGAFLALLEGKTLPGIGALE